VPRDCAPPSANVAFFNDGQSPVNLDRLAVAPAGAGFVVSGAAAPLTLLPGPSVPLVVTADFAGARTGDNLAVLQATTTEGLEASIDLRLSLADAAGDLTEEFTVPEDIRIDVLFVVDNSGSMADDQQLLADNFNDFIEVSFDERNLDVQLGITTTDVISPGAARGRLLGEPPVLDGDDADEFAARAIVGIDGTALELGLEAMRLALEVPENANFVRPDASLAVIFVTDEEDGGDLVAFLPDPALSRTPDEYIALLEARKAGAVENAPVLVSAVLPPTGAPRYRAVVDHFGGSVLDITTPDWGTRLSEIARETFSLSRSFQLGTAPRPGSVRVTIDGVATDEFVVDVDRRAVVLDEPADGGAHIVITYAPQCS
jgi:hypothetical protein